MDTEQKMKLAAVMKKWSGNVEHTITDTTSDTIITDTPVSKAKKPGPKSKAVKSAALTIKVVKTEEEIRKDQLKLTMLGDKLKLLENAINSAAFSKMMGYDQDKTLRSYQTTLVEIQRFDI